MPCKRCKLCRDVAELNVLRWVVGEIRWVLSKPREGATCVCKTQMRLEHVTAAQSASET